MATKPQAPAIRADGLQLEEDRPFQEWFWTAERIVQCLFAALVVLAAAGLGGAGGPLARAVIDGPAGRVDYARVARWHRSDRLTIAFQSTADIHRLGLSAALIESFVIADIQPAPVRSSFVGDGIVLEFAAEPGARAEVSLTLTPDRPGLVRFRIGIDEAAPLSLTSAVLP